MALTLSIYYLLLAELHEGENNLKLAMMYTILAARSLA